MLKRLAAALGGLTLALGGTVAMAPAAHATPQACFYQVLEKHPGVNLEVVENACVTAAEGTPVSIQVCYFEMRAVYVPATEALAACRLAAEG
ncbi:hypothetical protein [Streptomyces sp. NPDC002671]